MKHNKKKVAFLLSIFIGLSSFGDDGLSNVRKYKEILDKSYNLINLDNVRQNNPEIDGNGVIVGVLDTAINTTHPSLIGKNLGTEGVLFKNSRNTTSGGMNLHGTHVAGIILGKKINDYEPYGVAHNAKFYNLGGIEESYYPKDDTNIVNDAFKNKNIKVINHSWGKGLYPLINTRLVDHRYKNLLDDLKSDLYFPRQWKNKTKIDNDIILYLARRNTEDLISLSKDDKILNVFAAGNSGIISSSVDSVVPSYDEDIRAWLNVGNLNALNTQKNADGSITLKNDFFIEWVGTEKDRNGREKRVGWEGIDGSLISSQLFVGSTNYSLLAPGFEILAANAAKSATYGEKYIPMTGTSMAAPMVSGAATLVAQKYKFLDGAQIADVLLTTANKDLHLPDVVVKAIDNAQAGYYVVYLNKEIPRNLDGTINENEVRQDLLKMGIPDSNDAITVTKILTNVKDKTGKISDKFVVKLTQEEYAGQGVLDVEKALKGLAILDLNRLNDKDIENFKGKNTAFYTIDTKGLSGKFSNDISQQTWLDDRHLLETDEKGNPLAINILDEKYRNIDKIGLKKDGAGTLILTGENSYEGPTRAVGGTLELQGNSDKKASIKGDAYAEKGAKFIVDNAVVKQNAYTDNGTLEVKSNNEILGKTYAQNSGIINLIKNSFLKTGEVILETGNIISDNDKTDIKATIETNNFTAKQGKNNIQNVNLDIKSNAINSAKSTLDILGNVFFNFTAATSSFNNFGNINIEDKLEIKSKTDFKNNKNSTLSLDTKDAIFYTLGSFINEGKLNFKTDAVDDLGLIIAGEKAILKNTEKLNVSLVSPENIDIINQKFQDGLGIEIVRTGEGIDANIAKNLITLNEQDSELLELSTEKTGDEKSLYFVMNTKEEYKNKTVQDLIKSINDSKKPDITIPNNKIVGKKSHPDPVKPDPVKPDPVKPDPVKPDPVKPDPVKP
ncbi:MAG: S8 family serine peptidase, partial [Campylobacter ureolyticus]